MVIFLVFFVFHMVEIHLTRGRPVLLQHGLLDAAVTWVMNFPDQSLALYAC